MSVQLTAPHSIWRSRWTTLALALTALTAMFWPTVASIARSWANDPLAHGYIIVPGVIYLVSDRRQLLKPLSPEAEWRAIPVIALFAALWFFASLARVGVVEQFCFIMMLVGFLWTVLGSSLMRLLLFPLGLLFFALPLGDRIIPMLQDWTAEFTVTLLAFSGVPVLLQTHVISIPQGSWRVAEACSGINYLTASLVVGYLYAGTAYRYWSHRAGFLVAAALVPLVANGVRVYGTILIASLAGPQSIEGTRHYLFGWLVFAAMMSLLFIAFGRWREVPGRPAALTNVDDSCLTRVTPLSAEVCVTLGLLLVGTAPLALRWYQRPLNHTANQRASLIVSTPWIVVANRLFPWTPHLQSASPESVRTYRSGTHLVQLYAGYYGATDFEAKPVRESAGLFPDPMWSRPDRGTVVRLDGQVFRVSETRIESSSAALLVWNWYMVDGAFTRSDYLALLLLAKTRLARSSLDSAVMAVAIEIGSEADPDAILRDFLLHLSVGNP